jgi:predicted amidohydrolase YtcJ
MGGRNAGVGRPTPGDQGMIQWEEPQIHRMRRLSPFSIPMYIGGDAGVITAHATDWPLAFPSPSPWVYMEAMVTRKDPYGQYPGQVGDPITLTQAIKVFTLGGAQVVMQEKENGSIEVGKYADMVVLDRNLFEIPVENIDSTKALFTIFEGKTVYARSAN